MRSRADRNLTLAVAALLVSGWMGSRTSPLEGAVRSDIDVVPAAVDFAAEDALAQVSVAPRRSPTPAAREPVQQVALSGVERPQGFGELIVRVRMGGKPLAGASVRVEGVDAVLNGPKMRTYRSPNAMPVEAEITLSGGNPHGAVIQADGTWSLDLAIPPGTMEWKDVMVKYFMPGPSERVIATVPLVRPGDTILVRDPWLDSPPLMLQFSSVIGEPFAPGLFVELDYEGRGDGSQTPAIRGRIQSDGTIRIPAVPMRSWDYRVRIPGLPGRWEPTGSFQHTGSVEPIVLSHTGHSLTVNVPSSGLPQERYYQLALVESGDAPESITFLVTGGVYTFPCVPEDVSGQLVLLASNLSEKNWLVGTVRYQSDLEVLRVPLLPGQRHLTLNP